MVFCGRPSKACQRCRSRKLRCDFQSPSCGQCIRAKASCSGYRDTNQLRIRDESESVQRKAHLKEDRTIQFPHVLTVSVDVRARDSFFTHFVVGSSKAWDFLKPFYLSTQAPEHLSLTIDAASLAYLSHQVYSDSILVSAREKYVSALHTTNKALRSPETLAKDTTIFTSLLLDLFEKFTYDDPQGITIWSGHVSGALALVNICGLDRFQTPAGLRFLVRLSTNSIICCVSNEIPVPPAVNAIRDFASEHLSTKDLKWDLTSMMIDYANLRYRVQRNDLPIDERIDLFTELDIRLRALFSPTPPPWQYKTTIINQPSERVLEQHFNTYGDRHITQTWNVLRLVRILLNESILDCCLLDNDGNDHDLSTTISLVAKKAAADIQTLSREICASAPQYLDPHGVAQSRSLSSTPSSLPSATTTPSSSAAPCLSPCCFDQKSNAYALIFPLYVAAWPRTVPDSLRQWVIRQLRFMASDGRLKIRNAAVVARCLEEGATVKPWTVYAMLGSYAFAA